MLVDPLLSKKVSRTTEKENLEYSGYFLYNICAGTFYIENIEVRQKGE